MKGTWEILFMLPETILASQDLLGFIMAMMQAPTIFQGIWNTLKSAPLILGRQVMKIRKLYEDLFKLLDLLSRGGLNMYLADFGAKVDDTVSRVNARLSTSFTSSFLKVREVPFHVKESVEVALDVFEKKLLGSPVKQRAIEASAGWQRFQKALVSTLTSLQNTFKPFYNSANISDFKGLMNRVKKAMKQMDKVPNSAVEFTQGLSALKDAAGELVTIFDSMGDVLQFFNTLLAFPKDPRKDVLYLLRWSESIRNLADAMMERHADMFGEGQAGGSSCLFEKQLMDCEHKSLLDQMKVPTLGQCGRCTLKKRNPHDAYEGAPPSLPRMEYASGSMLKVTCKETRYAMFLKGRQEGLKGLSFDLTCVDGSWVDPQGSSGLSQAECAAVVQVGKPELTTLKTGSKEHLYFMNTLPVMLYGESSPRNFHTLVPGGANVVGMPEDSEDVVMAGLIGKSGAYPPPLPLTPLYLKIARSTQHFGLLNTQGGCISASPPLHFMRSGISSGRICDFDGEGAETVPGALFDSKKFEESILFALEADLHTGMADAYHNDPAIASSIFGSVLTASPSVLSEITAASTAASLLQTSSKALPASLLFANSSFSEPRPMTSIIGRDINNHEHQHEHEGGPQLDEQTADRMRMVGLLQLRALHGRESFHEALLEMRSLQDQSSESSSGGFQIQEDVRKNMETRMWGMSGSLIRRALVAGGVPSAVLSEHSGKMVKAAFGEQLHVNLGGDHMFEELLNEIGEAVSDLRTLQTSVLGVNASNSEIVLESPRKAHEGGTVDLGLALLCSLREWTAADWDRVAKEANGRHSEKEEHSKEGRRVRSSGGALFGLMDAFFEWEGEEEKDHEKTLPEFSSCHREDGGRVSLDPAGVFLKRSGDSSSGGKSETETVSQQSGALPLMNLVKMGKEDEDRVPLSIVITPETHTVGLSIRENAREKVLEGLRDAVSRVAMKTDSVTQTSDEFFKEFVGKWSGVLSKGLDLYGKSVKKIEETFDKLKEMEFVKQSRAVIDNILEILKSYDDVFNYLALIKNVVALASAKHMVLIIRTLLLLIPVLGTPDKLDPVLDEIIRLWSPGMDGSVNTGRHESAFDEKMDVTTPESRLAVISKVPLAVAALSEPIPYSGALLSSVDKSGEGAQVLGARGYYQDALEFDCTRAAKGPASTTPGHAWVLSKFETPTISFVRGSAMDDVFVSGNYVCGLANVKTCKEEKVKISGQKWRTSRASETAEVLNEAAREFAEASAELNALTVRYQVECEAQDFAAAYAQWCAGHAEVPLEPDTDLTYQHLCCGGGDGPSFVSLDKSEPIIGFRDTLKGMVRTQGPGEKCVTDAIPGVRFPEDFLEYCEEIGKQYETKRAEVLDLQNSLIDKANKNAERRAEKAGMLELVGGAATCPYGAALQKFVATAEGRDIEVTRTCCSVSGSSVSISPLSHPYVPPSMRLVPDVDAWEGEYCPAERDDTGRLVFRMCTSFRTPQEEIHTVYGRNTLRFNAARMQWCLEGLDVPEYPMFDPLCLDSMTAHPAEVPTPSAASPGGNALGVTVVEDMIPLAPAPGADGDEILEKPKKPEKPPKPPLVPLKEVNMEDLYSPHCKAHDKEKLHGPLVKDLPEELTTTEEAEGTKFYKAATEPLPKEEEEDPDEYLFGQEEPAAIGGDRGEAMQDIDPCGYVLSNERTEAPKMGETSDTASIPFRAIAGCAARLGEREGAMGDATQSVEDLRESIQVPYDIATAIFSFIGSLTEFEFAPYGLGITIDPFDMVMQIAEFVWDKVNVHLDNKVADIEGSYGELGGGDCDQNDYFIAKTLCDISCVSDAVRTGNRAIMDRLQNVYDTLLKNLLTYMDYHASYSESLMQWLADLQDWHAQELGKKVAKVSDAVNDLSDSMSQEKSDSLLAKALQSCKATLPHPPAHRGGASPMPPNASSVHLDEGSSQAHGGRQSLIHCVSLALGIDESTKESVSADTPGKQGADAIELQSLADDLLSFRSVAEARLGALPCVGTNLHRDCRDADTQKSVLDFANQAAAHAKKVEARVRAGTEASMARLESLSSQMKGGGSSEGNSEAEAAHAVRSVLEEVKGHKAKVSAELQQHLDVLHMMGATDQSASTRISKMGADRHMEEGHLRVAGRVSEGDLHAFRVTTRSSMERVSESLDILEREVEMWSRQSPHSLSKVSLWMAAHRKRQAEISSAKRRRKSGSRQASLDALEKEIRELQATGDEALLATDTDRVVSEMEGFADAVKVSHASVNTYLRFAESHLGERRRVLGALDEYLACSDAEPYDALSQRWATLRRAEAGAARLLVRSWWTVSGVVQKVASRMSAFDLPLRLAAVEVDSFITSPWAAVPLLVGVIPSDTFADVETDSQHHHSAALLSSTLCSSSEVELEKQKDGSAKIEEWFRKGIRAGLSSGSLAQLVDFIDELVEITDFLQARMVEENLWHVDNQKARHISLMEEAHEEQGMQTGGSSPSPQDILPSREDAAITEDSLSVLDNQVLLWRKVIGSSRPAQRVAASRRRLALVSSSDSADAVRSADIDRVESLLSTAAVALHSTFCNEESHTLNEASPSPLDLLQRAEEAARHKHQPAERTRRRQHHKAVLAEDRDLQQDPDSIDGRPGGEEAAAAVTKDLPPFPRVPSGRRRGPSAPRAALDAPVALLQTDERRVLSEAAEEFVEEEGERHGGEAKQHEEDPDGEADEDVSETEGETEMEKPSEKGQEKPMQRVRTLLGECFELDDERAMTIAPLFSSLSCKDFPGSVLTAWSVTSCGSEAPGAGRLQISCTQLDTPPEDVTDDGKTPEAIEPEGEDMELPEAAEMTCSTVTKGTAPPSCPKGSFVTGFSFEPCAEKDEPDDALSLVTSAEVTEWRPVTVCGGLGKGPKDTSKCDAKLSGWTSGNNATLLSQELEKLGGHCGDGQAMTNLRLESEKPGDPSGKVRISYLCCDVPTKEGLEREVRGGCWSLEMDDADQAARAFSAQCGGPEYVLKGIDIEACPLFPPPPGRKDEGHQRTHRLKLTCALLLEVNWLEAKAPSLEHCSFQKTTDALNEKEWTGDLESAIKCPIIAQKDSKCVPFDLTVGGGIQKIAGTEMASGCPFSLHPASLYFLQSLELRTCGALDDFVQPHSVCVHSRAFDKEVLKHWKPSTPPKPTAEPTNQPPVEVGAGPPTPAPPTNSTPLAPTPTPPAPNSLIFGPMPMGGGSDSAEDETQTGLDMSEIPVRCDDLVTVLQVEPNPANLVQFPAHCPEGFFMQSRTLEVDEASLKSHNYRVSEHSLRHNRNLHMKCPAGTSISVAKSTFKFEMGPPYRCEKDMTKKLGLAADGHNSYHMKAVTGATMPNNHECHAWWHHYQGNRVLDTNYFCLKHSHRQEPAKLCENEASKLTCQAGFVLRVLRVTYRAKSNSDTCTHQIDKSLVQTANVPVVIQESNKTTVVSSEDVLLDEGERGETGDNDEVGKTFVDESKVSAFCDGKPSCAFTPSNGFFGNDPTPGKFKVAQVDYICHNPVTVTDVTATTRCCGSPDSYGSVEKAETESQCVSLDGPSVGNLKGLQASCPPVLDGFEEMDVPSAMTALRLESCGKETNTYRYRATCQGIRQTKKGAVVLKQDSDSTCTKLDEKKKELDDVFRPLFTEKSEGWSCPLGRFLSFAALTPKGCSDDKLKLSAGCTQGLEDVNSMANPEDLFVCEEETIKKDKASCPNDAIMKTLKFDTTTNHGDYQIPFFKFQCCRPKDGPRAYPYRWHEDKCTSAEGFVKKLTGTDGKGATLSCGAANWALRQVEIHKCGTDEFQLKFACVNVDFVEKTEYVKGSRPYTDPSRMGQTASYAIKGPCGFPKPGVSKRLPPAFSTQLSAPLSLMQDQQNSSSAIPADASVLPQTASALLASPSEPWLDERAALLQRGAEHSSRVESDDESLSLSQPDPLRSTDPLNYPHWMGSTLRHRMTGAFWVHSDPGYTYAARMNHFGCPPGWGWLTDFAMWHSYHTSGNHARISYHCRTSWERGTCQGIVVSHKNVETTVNGVKTVIKEPLSRYDVKTWDGAEVQCPEGTALTALRWVLSANQLSLTQTEIETIIRDESGTNSSVFVMEGERQDEAGNATMSEESHSQSKSDWFYYGNTHPWKKGPAHFVSIVATCCRNHGIYTGAEAKYNHKPEKLLTRTHSMAYKGNRGWDTMQVPANCRDSKIAPAEVIMTGFRYIVKQNRFQYEVTCQRITRGIDGGFSEWSAWGPCTSTCQSFRFRTCTNPHPARGGKGCDMDEETVQVKSCGPECTIGAEEKQALKIGQVDPSVGALCSADAGFFLAGATQESCGKTLEAGKEVELVRSVHQCKLPIDLRTFPPRDKVPPVTCKEHRTSWYHDMKGPVGVAECKGLAVMDSLRWITEGPEPYSDQSLRRQCEDKSAFSHTCPEGKTVKVIQAKLFGPLDPDAPPSVCHKTRNWHIQEHLERQNGAHRCNTIDVLDTVSNWCHGRRSCSINPHPDALGVPKCTEHGVRTLYVTMGCEEEKAKSRVVFSCCETMSDRGWESAAMEATSSLADSKGLPGPSIAVLKGSVFHQKFLRSSCFPAKDVEGPVLESGASRLDCPDGYFLQGYKVTDCAGGGDTDRQFLYKCALIDRRPWETQRAKGKAAGVCAAPSTASTRFQFDCGPNGFLSDVSFDACSKDATAALSLIAPLSSRHAGSEKSGNSHPNNSMLLQSASEEQRRANTSVAAWRDDTAAMLIAEAEGTLEVKGMCAGLDLGSDKKIGLRTHCLKISTEWKDLPGNVLKGEPEAFGLQTFARMPSVHCLRFYGGTKRKSGLLSSVKVTISSDGMKARFEYQCCLSSREEMMGRKGAIVVPSHTQCAPVSDLKGSVPDNLNFGCNGADSGYALTSFAFEPCVPSNWWEPSGWFRVKFFCAAANWPGLNPHAVAATEGWGLPVDDTLNDCERVNHICEQEGTSAVVNGKNACEEAEACAEFCGEVPDYSCRFLDSKKRKK
eukprot:Cvel_21662.t1-p1 / transcript=Cvel_21662.t1 / gene=Cvel_21662 / organism=Chromera_velia_CCMP2878 / gene_product=hypothetical protein / transcript_product=hypothetical protein / location=Cvel_scaffold2050:23-24990(-) / protein_length=4956 / sequence_SO=supercontig / SO=protein_coding / is_pseudo=false